jgi:Fe-S-cluster containining protein
MDANEFAERISGSKPYLYEMKKTKEGKCFFLKNKQCTIYNNRPLICRFYPFQLKNLTNNRYVFSYTNKCPGVSKEPKLKTAFFEKLFSEFTTAMEQNMLLSHCKKKQPIG